MSELLVQKKYDSDIGPIFLVASSQGLRGVFWKKQKASMGDSSILQQAENQLSEYLAGKRKNFQLKLDFKGTDFQMKVWATLLKIPYGETISYKELAKKIKNEKAVRAVGTANGKNPLCLIIPCHRVITSNGTLGGYSGGLSIKKKLIDLESH